MARSHRTGHGIGIAVVVALCLAVPALAPLPAAAQCPGTPLVNATFEDGYSERGAGEVAVANGWRPFWQAGPFQEDGRNLRPEYKPEDAARFGPRRVHGGNFSQKWFNTFGTHNAGIYQQVGVPEGSVVTFSAWGQAWSSDDSDPDATTGGWYALYVGIDPTGGTDWTSPAIVWSEPSRVLNEWAQIAVTTQARASAVTVYIRGYAEFRTKHNDAYVDDACLTYVAPTPRPTNTPRPTDTPTNTPTPLPTSTPADTPTPPDTPTPARTDASAPSPTPEATATPETGAIRFLTYEDANGNGVRDDGEPLVGRAGYQIRDAAGTPIEAFVTGETGEPTTLGNLTPGDYSVESWPLPGWEATSPDPVAVTVGAGETAEVAFGVRWAPTETPTPTDTPPAAPDAAPTFPPRLTATPTPTGGAVVRRYGSFMAALAAVILVVLMRVLRGRE